MTWTNLLFLHWPLIPDLLRPLIPAKLELDTFDDRAWIGLVPFRMESCRFRGVPPLASTVNFYECNVRTYVRHQGRSGVWFFSLDAQTLLPVLGGRTLWNLNYVHSRFAVSHEPDGPIDYALSRRRGRWPSASAHIVWKPGSAMPPSTPGSLEFFLTERYWLFTHSRGRLLAGRINHQPWSLRSASLLQLDQSLTTAAGVPNQDISANQPLAFASDRTDVIGWSLSA